MKNSKYIELHVKIFIRFLMHKKFSKNFFLYLAMFLFSIVFLDFISLSVTNNICIDKNYMYYFDGESNCIGFKDFCHVKKGVYNNNNQTYYNDVIFFDESCIIFLRYFIFVILGIFFIRTFIYENYYIKLK